MFEKLESVARRSEELTKLLSDPAVLADPEMLRRYAKEQADLRPVVSAYHEYRKLQHELQENQELLGSESQDSEFSALIKEEVAALEARLETLKLSCGPCCYPVIRMTSAGSSWRSGRAPVGMRRHSLRQTCFACMAGMPTPSVGGSK